MPDPHWYHTITNLPFWRPYEGSRVMHKTWQDKQRKMCLAHIWSLIAKTPCIKAFQAHFWSYYCWRPEEGSRVLHKTCQDYRPVVIRAKRFTVTPRRLYCHMKWTQARQARGFKLLFSFYQVSPVSFNCLILLHQGNGHYNGVAVSTEVWNSVIDCCPCIVMPLCLQCSG